VHAAGALALRRTADANQRQSGPGLVLVTVLAVGTPIWLIQFGIYRYFVFGELLVSLLIVHCITVLARQRTVLICWLTLVLIVVGSTLVHAPNWGRDLPLRVDGLNPGTPGRSTYVVLVGGQPIGYLTSSFAAHTHFLTLSSFAESGNDSPGRLYLEGPLRDQYESFLSGARTANNLYAVIDGEYPILPPPLDQFALEGCHQISIPMRPMTMCKVGFPP
jgi:hypothetical protein